MIQRRLARQYDVILVPKRPFVAVLTTPGATVDGIHLSKQGHALMAEMMWQAVARLMRRKSKARRDESGGL